MPTDSQEIPLPAQVSASPQARPPNFYVYVIRVCGPEWHIKIGVASDPLGRIEAFQTANGRRLEFIAAMLCKSRLEAYHIEGCLHRELADERLETSGGGSEWFSKKAWKRIRTRGSSSSPDFVDNHGCRQMCLRAFFGTHTYVTDQLRSKAQARRG